MSHVEDRNYHQLRAEAELQLAERSDDPAIANIHRELAAMHRRLLMTTVEADESLALAATPIRRGH